LSGVRLDSGDLLGLSKKVRIILDKKGLNYVKIFASGNLDEYRIEELLENDAKIDAFGVGTRMGTSHDKPSVDVVYKLCGRMDKNGKFIPRYHSLDLDSLFSKEQEENDTVQKE